MDGRTVKALGVVLEHELPVGSHVVDDPVPHGEPRQAVATDPFAHRRPYGFERLGVARDVHEQEPFRFRESRGVKWIGPLVEAVDLLHPGRADQIPVEGIGPSVVGALDRSRQMTGRLAADSGPTVAADIEECAEHSLGVAEHDDRLLGDVAEEIVARPFEPRGAPDAIPSAGEDPIPLLRQNRRRGVEVSWKRAGALPVRRRCGMKLRHALPPFRLRCPSTRWADSHPDPPRTPGPGWVPTPPR